MMKRRTKAKIKNFILLAITALMGAMYFLSITMLDSESCIPIIAFTGSAVWLGLFGIANCKQKRREKR